MVFFVQHYSISILNRSRTPKDSEKLQDEALGGELHIESSPGKGTRIEGTIPLQKKG